MTYVLSKGTIEKNHIDLFVNFNYNINRKLILNIINILLKSASKKEGGYI